jgi:hypothetical protein
MAFTEQFQAGRVALFENGNKYFDKTGVQVSSGNPRLYVNI